MNNFPTWFTVIIKTRLESFYNEMKQDELIQIEKADFDILFHIFVKELDKESRDQFLQLEEVWTRIEDLEKEWIYNKGLKDGVKLMLSML